LAGTTRARGIKSNSTGSGGVEIFTTDDTAPSYGKMDLSSALLVALGLTMNLAGRVATGDTLVFTLTVAANITTVFLNLANVPKRQQTAFNGSGYLEQLAFTSGDSAGEKSVEIRCSCAATS
jgi:hypothetical protein